MASADLQGLRDRGDYRALGSRPENDSSSGGRLTVKELAAARERSEAQAPPPPEAGSSSQPAAEALLEAPSGGTAERPSRSGQAAGAEGPRHDAARQALAERERRLTAEEEWLRRRERSFAGAQSHVDGGDTARGSATQRPPAPAALPAAPKPAAPSLILEKTPGSPSSPASSTSPAPSATMPEAPPATPPVWLRPRPAEHGSKRTVEPPTPDVGSPPAGPEATYGSGGTPTGPADDGDLRAREAAGARGAKGATGGTGTLGATGAMGGTGTRAAGAASVPEAAALPSDAGAGSSPSARRALPSAAARTRTPADLNGSWEVHNVVNSTSYPSYRGLRLTYHVNLRHEGGRIVGDGEKWAENDRRVPAARRTPIHLTGEVVGQELRVEFTEQGGQRDSSGNFRWRLSPDGRSLAGTFASDAAGSRGISAAYRLP